MKRTSVALIALTAACAFSTGLLFAQVQPPPATARGGRGPATTRTAQYAVNLTTPLLPKPDTRPADWLVEHPPVSPNASPEAKALLHFLYGISGKHTLIGQHNFAGVPELSTAVAARNLGKVPALYGTDWGFSRAGDIDSIFARPNTVKEVIKQYQLGSTIAICWHEVNPTADEPVTFQGTPTSVQSKLTDAQWDELLTPDSPLNKRWCAQVDVIAGYLKQLEAAHVPILWRPVHEMNGNWFWWGNRIGERGTKQYYRMMFDRLVKFHKLTNLIWLWNCDQPSTWDRQFVDYFPGQDYVDVLALDCYGQFQQRFYDEMNALSDGKVMVVSEGGPIPLDIYATQPKWAYYMPWAGVRSPVTDGTGVVLAGNTPRGGGAPPASGRAPATRGGPGASANPANAAGPTTGPAASRRGGGAGGGGGGGGRGGVNLAEMVKDPRMWTLDDAAYMDAITPIRAASGLPATKPAPRPAPAPASAPAPQ